MLMEGAVVGFIIVQVCACHGLTWPYATAQYSLREGLSARDVHVHAPAPQVSPVPCLCAVLLTSLCASVLPCMGLAICTCPLRLWRPLRSMQSCRAPHQQSIQHAAALWCMS